MFVRRGRQVYLRTAPAGPEPITDEPIPPAVDPTSVPAPVKPADGPKFDPESPEVKAYLAEQRKLIAAQEGGKARDTARQTEREATLAKIAEALGLKPAEVDPAKIADELTAARAEARTLRIDRAVDVAARALKADGEIIGAMLEKAGKLKGLDPAADDFAAKIEALVADVVKSNPRVLLEIGTPPGGQAPVNGGFQGSPTGAQRPSMLQAVNERLFGAATK